MSTVPFVTCDLLDDNPEKDLQVVTPSMDGKFFKSYGARQTFGGQVVTVKCFEDNSRVKSYWLQMVQGRYWLWMVVLQCAVHLWEI